MLSYDPSALLTFPEGVVGTYPIQLIVTTTEGCSDNITLELEIIPDIIFYAQIHLHQTMTNTTKAGELLLRELI